MLCNLRMQAFDKGPWPRMTGRQRGLLMNKLADLMQVLASAHGRTSFSDVVRVLAECNAISASSNST